MLLLLVFVVNIMWKLFDGFYLREMWLEIFLVLLILYLVLGMLMNLLRLLCLLNDRFMLNVMVFERLWLIKRLVLM